MNQRIVQFLAAGHESTDPQYRRILLNHLVALICVGGTLVFIPITAYSGNYPALGALSFMACGAVFNLWAVRSGIRLAVVANLTAASLAVLYLALIVTSPIWPSGLYWITVFPVYVAFSLDPDERRRWIGVVLGLLALFLLGQAIELFGSRQGLFDLMMLTAVFCVIAVLCLVPEQLHATTERDLAQTLARREEQSVHDALTGLPNQHLLNLQLDAVIANARRHQRPCAVLLVDIDGFRNINETVGRNAGDEVLTVSADRLRKALRMSDFIGRYGGDEFIALLPEAATEQQINAVAQKCIRMLSKPIPSRKGLLQVGVNIGIARLAEHGNNLETLVAAAFQALDTARREGSNRFAYAQTGFAVS